MIEHGFIALHPHFSRDVIRFGLAHQRVQQQSVHRFQGALDYVLVSAMDRVSSLKRNDSPPALLLKGVTSLCRIEAEAWKRRVSRPIQQADGSAQQPLALLVKRGDARMRRVRRQINPFGLALFVIAELLPQMQHSEQVIVDGEKRDVGTFGQTAREII